MVTIGNTLHSALLPFIQNNRSTFLCRGSFCFHGIVLKLLELEIYAETYEIHSYCSRQDDLSFFTTRILVDKVIM
jgi:hypothetical protein